MNLTYPFTESDSQRAFDEWGANCGPNALAFALQIPLSAAKWGTAICCATEDAVYSIPVGFGWSMTHWMPLPELPKE